MKKGFILLLISFCCFQFTTAQTATTEKLLVSLQNVEIETDYVEFDIYLRSGNADGSAIYLGHTDIVLEMQQGSFENPRLEKVDQTCTLIPEMATDQNKLFLRSNYYNAISCQVRSGQGLVNLAAISPNSEAAVKRNIAKIDGTVGVHKLARFRMYGFQGGDKSGLSIRVPGIQLTNQEAVRKWNYKSKSHTLATTGRFRSTPVEIELDDQWYTHTIDNQLDEVTEGIEVRSGEEMTFSMFPNPVVDRLNIIITGPTDQLPDRLLVFDLAGKLIHNANLESNNYIFNVEKENIGSGTYIVQLMQGDTIIWQDKTEVIR